LFTSETKKACSDREAPVNHIGYLRTFIHKTHVVTSVIALWIIYAHLRIDARCWMVKEKGHGNIKKIVAHLVFTVSVVNISF